MKMTGKKLLAFALIALTGLSVATPVRADWYDGHRHHHGHVPRGWVYNARLHYYVYAPAYVVAPPAGIVIAQPAPPPVIIAAPAPPPQVVYAAPPAYIGPTPPLGLNLALRFR